MDETAFSEKWTAELKNAPGEGQFSLADLNTGAAPAALYGLEGILGVINPAAETV